MDFSILDDLSDIGSNLYGKVVDTFGAAVDSIAVDDQPEKVQDKTVVEPDNKLPIRSFYETYQTPILAGGALLGGILLYTLFFKKG